MIRTATGPAKAAGPVLAAILTTTAAEDVLRRCFAEARDRTVGVRVLLAGPAPAAGEDVLLSDLVDRWAEKYPDVPVTIAARSGLDAAITLTAATRRCVLVVVAEPADTHEAAVVQALARRAYCPLVVVTPHPKVAEPAVDGRPGPFTSER
jgi:hypothetical protein